MRRRPCPRCCVAGGWTGLTLAPRVGRGGGGDRARAPAEHVRLWPPSQHSTEARGRCRRPHCVSHALQKSMVSGHTPLLLRASVSQST